ncbi:MAG: ATP synthase subunit I [Pseudomonadota bacterium]
MSSSSEQSVAGEGSQNSAEALARTMVWLLRTEAVLTAIAAVGLALWLGRDAALAGLVGGAIGIVLTAVAALRMVIIGNHAEPAQMVMAFYRGMAMKLVLAVVLFTIVAKWFAGFFLPVLIGYIATLVAYWLALWRLRVATIAKA